ncbi:hypothetical protein [Methylococcus capsulatus]|jgi:hypothetical protein|nr:hypothetical protein [Methylococcus capsulatus]
MDMIERQLGRAEGNEVKAACNHAEHLPERRKIAPSPDFEPPSERTKRPTTWTGMNGKESGGKGAEGAAKRVSGGVVTAPPFSRRVTLLMRDSSVL